MPRKRRGFGVGRGNGAGSRATQFQSGMPSANPNGAPRKKKVAPSTSVAEAAQKALFDMVNVQIGDGRFARMTRLDAMMKKMVSGFGEAPFKEQMAFMKLFHTAGMIAERPSYVPPEDAVAQVLADLDRMNKEDDERNQLLGRVH